DFQFNSEVFMFAVIAPLLFVEGTHVSRTKLLEYRKPILLMSMIRVGEKILSQHGPKRPLLLGSGFTVIGLILLSLTFLPEV
ncbi:hypothetical protein P7349_15380, partial [Staphylococcus aureus]|nr:hypothetical protein [Staphylococcus aureus]